MPIAVVLAAIVAVIGGWFAFRRQQKLDQEASGRQRELDREARAEQASLDRDALWRKARFDHEARVQAALVQAFLEVLPAIVVLRQWAVDLDYAVHAREALTAPGLRARRDSLPTIEVPAIHPVLTVFSRDDTRRWAEQVVELVRSLQNCLVMDKLPEFPVVLLEDATRDLVVGCDRLLACMRAEWRGEESPPLEPMRHRLRKSPDSSIG